MTARSLHASHGKFISELKLVAADKFSEITEAKGLKVFSNVVSFTAEVNSRNFDDFIACEWTELSVSQATRKS